MKFSEAMLAGLKVAEQTVGDYVNLNRDGKLCGCAAGLALIGAGQVTPEGFITGCGGAEDRHGDYARDRLYLLWPKLNLEHEGLTADLRSPASRGKPSVLSAVVWANDHTSRSVPEIAAALAKHGL